MTEHKSPQWLEDWLNECAYAADTIDGDSQCFVVSENDLKKLLSGKALVPVDAISKTLHGLEHLKADIRARSKLQEDYQEGVVMVGAVAWHALCSAILMLSEAKGGAK